MTEPSTDIPQSPSGPGNSREPAAPWRLDGVDPRHQAAAIRGAARDGIPLARWLGSAIEAAASAQSGRRVGVQGLRMLAIGLAAGTVLGGAATYVVLGFERLASAPPPVPAAGTQAAAPARPAAALPAPPPAGNTAPAQASPSQASPAQASPAQASPAQAAPTQPTATPSAAQPPARVVVTDPLETLRREARGGDTAAQFELGARYAGGDGVPQDWAEAVNWFRMAAEAGVGRAQHNLAVLYERGRGVPADMREAVRWYERAAEQGYAASQYNLGAAHARGIDGPPDMARAIAWLEKAAARLPQADVALGEIHEGGLAPGGRDLGRARTHYLRAAAAGDARAATRLEELTQEAVARETLREIQQRLTRLRLYAGDLDGLTGPRTAAAIRRFQRDQRLEEDGKPSQDLLARLRAATGSP